MVLVLFGQDISEAAQEAAARAVAAQRRSFTLQDLVPSILPHIQAQKGAWREATPERVAVAVAHELVWQATRAGTVQVGDIMHGIQYWRPVRPGGAS